MKNYNDIITAAREELSNRKDRRAWNKGVTVYALELLAEVEESITGGWNDADILESPKLIEKAMLNGASDWNQYSWGGCSLIYDRDIAERLSNPTELKITRNGERKPNAREEWLDTQARALWQAARRVRETLQRAM